MIIISHHIELSDNNTQMISSLKKNMFFLNIIIEFYSRFIAY